MKCPKCEYLGFETGDRCKNCGYDFSLLAPVTVPGADFAIRTDDAETGAPELWLDRMDRSMDDVSKPDPNPDHLVGVPEPQHTAPVLATDDGLPLFNPDDPDDIPLIAVPTAPRPLSVRRAPEAPRLRAVPKGPRMPAAALDFLEEAPVEATEADYEPAAAAHQPETPRRRHPEPARGGVAGRRLAAALIDNAILLAIDLAVVYFTLRMAGLQTSELELLPMLPMLSFLAVLKLSYFSAFTAVGGQTIGKMATGIQVVGDRGSIDGSRAVRRTIAAVLSIVPFGLGFVPALFGEQRALHDRLAGTRVVARHSA